MHEGHRQRMYEKLSDIKNLHNHEVLEVLLFAVIPRVNTNVTAHNLLDKFGTITGVFNATFEQLVSVEGVGDKTAWHIVCIGECLRRAVNEATGIAVLKNIGDFKNFVVARMRGKISEILEFYFLDKNGKIQSIKTFSNFNQNMVEIGTEEIARVFASEKPYGLLVAHNHLSGSCMPSSSDNRFTMQVAVLCNINKVNLFDHCIYASDTDVYSYRMTGELDDIKKTFTFNNIMTEHMNNVMKKK